MATLRPSRRTAVTLGTSVMCWVLETGSLSSYFTNDVDIVLQVGSGRAQDFVADHI